jgi:hypothetical protein
LKSNELQPAQIAERSAAALIALIRNTFHRTDGIYAVHTAQATERIDRSAGCCAIFVTRKNMSEKRYYDHVIRNERALNHIRRYIVSNPARWQADRLNAK